MSLAVGGTAVHAMSNTRQKDEQHVSLDEFIQHKLDKAGGKVTSRLLLASPVQVRAQVHRCL